MRTGVVQFNQSFFTNVMFACKLVFEIMQLNCKTAMNTEVSLPTKNISETELLKNTFHAVV